MRVRLSQRLNQGGAALIALALLFASPALANPSTASTATPAPSAPATASPAPASADSPIPEPTDAETAAFRAKLAEKQAELDELAAIYVRRGLEPALARTVAEQLTAHDGLGSHLRDELGFNEHSRAKPVQAALASAAAFTCGALPPVLLAWLWQKPGLATAIVACTLVLLAVLGYVAERVAGGRGLFGAGRVVLWGALAMVATALIGSAFGVSV